jgi:hypothetical protein
MTPDPEAALEFAIRHNSDATLAAMAVAKSSRCLQSFPHDERALLGTVVSELASNGGQQGEEDQEHQPSAHPHDTTTGGGEARAAGGASASES